MSEFHLHGALNISMCFHVEADNIEEAQQKVGELLNEASSRAEEQADAEQAVTFDIPAPIVDVTLLITPELDPAEDDQMPTMPNLGSRKTMLN